MPSPFPGMDPYLEDEGVFPNFHAAFLVRLVEALNAAMPRGFVATSATRVWVDDSACSEPDVAVVSRRPRPGGSAFDPAALAQSGLVPVVSRPTEPLKQLYLDIVTPQGRRLVTHIELLSPSNKASGRGRRLYKRKQRECLLGGVNLVEIDLLRAGRHATSADLPRALRQTGGFDYHVALTVPAAYPTVYVQPIRLEDPLPKLTVPLDRGTPPVEIALRPVIDRCYDAGRFEELIDYARPCHPPLTPARQTWAAGMLAGRGE